MKGLGIAIAGLLAIAGGIAAATIITKKKLERENDEDYYDDWDEEWDDDGEDFDFDEDEDIADAAEYAAQPEVNTAAIITAATAANLLIPIPPDTQNAAMQTASPHCFARITRN